MPAPRAARRGGNAARRHGRATTAVPAPAANTPPCSTSSACAMPKRPLATQLCVRLIEVEVDDEAEQREQQVPVAGAARVDVRQADGQQQQVDGCQHQPEAPDQFALVARRGRAHQLGGVDASWPAARCARRKALIVDQHAIALEARDGRLAGAGVDVVALAAFEHQEALVALHLDAPATRRGHGFQRRPCSTATKTLRTLTSSRGSRSTKKTRCPSRRALEHARRDARQVRALRIAVAQLAAVAVDPGPDERQQQRDHQQHRPAGAQHRPHEARQVEAAGEPDRHLAVAVHAAQRDDDGDEQRQVRIVGRWPSAV